REALARASNVQVLSANGEDLPFRDGYFDVATSIFTFHELPRSVRHRVLDEMHRVLRPGGLLVIEDSAQSHDGLDLAYFMGRFSREFHEPYYDDYVEDALESSLETRGFAIERIEP